MSKTKYIVIFGGIGFVIFTILVALVMYLFLGSARSNAPTIKITDTQRISPEDLQKFKKSKRDSLVFAFIDSISTLNEMKSLRLQGNRISIMVTGLDARIGSCIGHADANHLINIWLDSAIIEIISIPRGTLVDIDIKPMLLCDTTEEGITIDTIPQNYLANARYLKGRDKYIAEVSKITNTYGINYYVEFGFSQAMGIMELLGYKDNSDKMLRILRSRKTFSSGDYHRAYNQGQFIRQMILKHFNKLSGMEGDILLFAGLMLVEANLPYKQAGILLEKLKDRGFPRTEDDIIVRVMPRVKYHFNEFDFTDASEMDSLHNKIYSKYKKNKNADLNIKHVQGYSEANPRLMKKLSKLIQKAVRDSAKYPRRVISTLKTPFHQRAWFQVNDSANRIFYRHQICTLLSDAYKKAGKDKQAYEVIERLEAEERVFDNK